MHGPTIPMINLAAQHAEARGPILDRLFRVIEHGQFINGPEVAELEAAIATRVGAEAAVGCASGTDALFLALRSLDLQPGDEVITTPFTFFATAGAIVNAGGTPVFVDIDPETYLMDPVATRAAVTPKTRAIVAVHLYGQMVDMAAMAEIAQARELVLIEDGAQSFGATQRGRHAGTLGDFGTLSFFPSKTLGGWGDGGMILTQSLTRAERVRRLKAHGGSRQYHHEEVGVNSRLDTIQAAVLLAKLGFLDSWQAARDRTAARYTTAFQELTTITPPVTAAGNRHAYHQYTLQCDSLARRERLREALAARGAQTMVYYPTPLHRQPCFAALGYGPEALPVASTMADRVVSLPMGPHLHPLAQDDIIEIVRQHAAA